MADKTINTELKISGEREYKEACDNIKNALKNVNSELAVVTAEFGKNNTSIEGLTARLPVLHSRYDEQKKKIEAAQKAQETYIAAGLQPSDVAMQELTRDINYYQAALIRTEKEIQENEKAIAANADTSKNYIKTVGEIDKTLSVLESELKTAAASFGDNANSAEALKIKSESLSKIQDEQAKKVRELSAAYERSAAESGAMSDESVKLKLELEKAKQEAASTGTQFKKTEEALRDAAGASGETETGIRNLAKAEDDAREKTSLFGDVLKASLAADAIKASISFIVDGIKSMTASVTDYISAGQQMTDSSVQNQAKLTQVMRNTMEASDGEIESIVRLTREQEKLGVVSANTQIAGAQELGTYLTKKSTLEKLLPTMNDMVAQQYGVNASQESAASIATMLGKVMNGQVGALSRYGYTFDEAQEKILKFGTEEQRAAVLADVVAESVGGMNAALGRMDAGKMERFNAVAEQTQERVGEIANTFKAKILGEMLPSIESLSDAFLNLLNGDGSAEEMSTAIKKAVDSAIKVIKNTLPEIIGLGTEIISALVEGIVDNIDSIIDGGAMVVGQLKDAILALLPKIIEAGAELVKALASGLLKSFPQVVGAFGELITKSNDLVKVLALVVAAVVSFNAVTKISAMMQAFTTTMSAAKIVLNEYAIAAAASEHVSVLLASTLTPFQTIVGVLTGKVSLATVATNIWNAALAANPVGLIAVGVAALAVGIGAVIIAMNSASTETQQLINQSKELTESMKELRKEALENQLASYENFHAIENQAAANDQLYESIVRLSGQEVISTEDKAKLNSQIKMLNDAVPGLALAFDEETESLNMSNEALLMQVQNREAALKIEAAQERQKQIAIEQLKTEGEITASNNTLKELEKEIDNARGVAKAGLQKRYDELSASIERSAKVQESLKVEISDLDKVIAKNTITVEKNAAATKAAADAAAEAEAKAARERMEAAEELTGVIEKAQKTIVKAEEEAQEARNKIQEAEKERLELMQKAYDTYVKVAQDAFGRLNDPIKISLDEMIANLDQNQKDMEEWTNGLAELSKSGLDKGFVQNLRDMGPGTRLVVADLLNDLNTTGGEKIEALNKSWAKGAADSTKAVQDEFNDPSFIADTASAIDKIAKKIEDNEAIAIQCEQKILNAQHKMKTAIKNADFEQMGLEIPEGLKKGIDNGSQDAINAVVEMMNAIIEEGRLVLDINSPSKVFEQIGKYLDEGLELGIDKNAASAIKASMDMAQGVIDGAAKVMRAGSSEQIQIEIDKLNSILEENRKAASELKRSQDIAEKESAVRTAKNAEEKIKAQQTLTETLKSYAEEQIEAEINAQIKALEETQKQLDERKKQYEETEKSVMSTLKKLNEEALEVEQYHLGKQVEAVKEATDEKIKQYQRDYDEKVKRIDEASQAEIKALQSQLDALDGQNQTDTAYDNAKKLIELNQAVMKAATGNGDYAKALEAYNAEMKRQQDERAASEKKAQKELLQAQIKGIEEAAAEKKKLLDEQNKAMEEAYNEQKEYFAHVSDLEVQIAETKNGQLRQLLQEELDEYKRVNEEKVKLSFDEKVSGLYDEKLSELKSKISESTNATEKARLQKQLDELEAYKDEYFNNVTLLQEKLNNLAVEAEKESSLEIQKALAKKYYAEMNEEENLQAEARRQLLKDNEDAAISTLSEYNDDWKQQSKERIVSMNEGAKEGIANLSASVSEAVKTLDTIKYTGVAEALRKDIAEAETYIPKYRSLGENLAEAVKTGISTLQSIISDMTAGLTETIRSGMNAMGEIIRTKNDEIVTMFDEYKPKWFAAGESFVDNMTEGANFQKLIDKARAAFEEIWASISETASGGEEAPVDDPWSHLRNMTPLERMKLADSHLGRSTYNVNINQPVDNPSEMAREIKNTLIDAGAEF